MIDYNKDDGDNINNINKLLSLGSPVKPSFILILTTS